MSQQGMRDLYAEFPLATPGAFSWATASNEEKVNFIRDAVGYDKAWESEMKRLCNES